MNKKVTQFNNRKELLFINKFSFLNYMYLHNKIASSMR